MELRKVCGIGQILCVCILIIIAIQAGLSGHVFTMVISSVGIIFGTYWGLQNVNQKT